MNTIYEILTDHGFEDFLTISTKTVGRYLKITFTDATEIKCTFNHKFKKNDDFIEAQTLQVDDVLAPFNKTVLAIETVHETVDVYDLVDVSNGNHYLTNDITSHNCEFLTEELTLIDGDVVRKSEVRINERIKASEHIKLSLNNDKYKLFEIPQKGSIYMISVDPSTGNGRDNGVVQVFEFPSMVQVMEYTSNALSPHVLYTELKSIIQFFERFSDEVYFTVENNGVGQGIIAAYEGDMNPPNAMLVSENGKLGFTTTLKSKTRACLQFKDLYERGKMVINSIDLLTELKSFIRSSTSGYSAQVGATDDRVMAIIIMFYIIQEISNSNASAYDMVYTVASEIEERHGWKSPSAENEDPPDTSRVGLGVLTNAEPPRSEQLTDLFSSFKRW